MIEIITEYRTYCHACGWEGPTRDQLTDVEDDVAAHTEDCGGSRTPTALPVEGAIDTTKG